MRVLLIHNFYLQKGGEDTVFRLEKKLLMENGNEVDSLEFHNENLRSITARISLLWNAIFNFSAYFKLLKKIDEFQPHVIHIHNIFYAASPSLLYAARKRKIPVVMTLHNYRLICPSVYLYHDGMIYEDSIKKTFPIKAIKDRVWNGSFLLTSLIAIITGLHKISNTWRNYISAYIVFTEFAKDKFLDSSLKVPKDKFYIKPNFTEDSGFNVGERKDYYLYIGRLSEEKGIDVLLDAASKTGIKLEILGDGPYREVVEEFASRYNNIKYLGFQSKDTILEKLKSCRALIFPSLWYEGMPMVILEAMATATPVIVSKLGNPERMIENYKNGIHFNPNDSESLSSTIEQFNSCEELRRKLAKGAREIYMSKYTPAKNYKNLLSIYEEVQR